MVVREGGWLWVVVREGGNCGWLCGKVVIVGGCAGRW